MYQCFIASKITMSNCNTYLIQAGIVFEIKKYCFINVTDEK